MLGFESVEVLWSHKYPLATQKSSSMTKIVVRGKSTTCTYRPIINVNTLKCIYYGKNARVCTVETLGRMRTPVREAFSYGIRHGIRHINCDSMKHKVILHWITMNMPYSVWKCLLYGSTHPPYYEHATSTFQDIN